MPDSLMKLCCVILSFLTIYCPLSLAQLTIVPPDPVEFRNAPAPSVDSAAAGTDTLAPAVPDLMLIPNLPEMIDKPARGAARILPIGPDPVKERIRYREAKTRALKDPAVQQEQERAENAATDSEKREALKNYYKLLHARMLKIDGSLGPQITAKEAQVTASFSQKRFGRKKSKLGEATDDDTE